MTSRHATWMRRGDVDAADANASALCVDEAEDQREERGLAGAARTAEHDPLTGVAPSC